MAEKDTLVEGVMCSMDGRSDSVLKAMDDALVLARELTRLCKELEIERDAALRMSMANSQRCSDMEREIKELCRYYEEKVV